MFFYLSLEMLTLKSLCRKKGNKGEGFQVTHVLVMKAVPKFVPFHGAAVGGFLFEADGSANRALSPFHKLFHHAD